MAKFKDANGREWPINLTVGMCSRLKREQSIDLSRTGNAQTLAELIFADPMTFGSTLWIVCEEQAAKLSVSPEEFSYALDGPAIESAATAFMEAIIDFFHRRKPAEAIKAKLPSVLSQAEEKIATAATEEMDRLTQV